MEVVGIRWTAMVVPSSRRLHSVGTSIVAIHWWPGYRVYTDSMVVVVVVAVMIAAAAAAGRRHNLCPMMAERIAPEVDFAQLED